MPQLWAVELWSAGSREWKCPQERARPWMLVDLPRIDADIYPGGSTRKGGRPDHTAQFLTLIFPGVIKPTG